MNWPVFKHYLPMHRLPKRRRATLQGCSPRSVATIVSRKLRRCRQQRRDATQSGYLQHEYVHELDEVSFAINGDAKNKNEIEIVEVAISGEPVLVVVAIQVQVDFLLGGCWTSCVRRPGGLKKARPVGRAQLALSKVDVQCVQCALSSLRHIVAIIARARASAAAATDDAACFFFRWYGARRTAWCILS